MWRRWGLALVLTAAVVAVYFAWTEPALGDRRLSRAERRRAEAERAEVRREVEALEGLREALRSDPLVRERLLDLRRVSPDVSGPLEVARPVEY